MLTAPVHPTPWALASRPSEGLVLRRATVDDVVELAALKRRVERRCYADLGSEEALTVRLHRRCTAWYLLTRIGEGDLVLVAEADGRVAGLGGARVERRPGGRPVLHLHGTYVEATGLGVGKALTRARLEAADRLGLTVVTADCLVPRGRPAPRPAELRLAAMGMAEVSPPTDSPTFPGVLVSHWAGAVADVLSAC